MCPAKSSSPGGKLVARGESVCACRVCAASSCSLCRCAPYLPCHCVRVLFVPLGLYTRFGSAVCYRKAGRGLEPRHLPPVGTHRTWPIVSTSGILARRLRGVKNHLPPCWVPFPNAIALVDEPFVNNHRHGLVALVREAVFFSGLSCQFRSHRASVCSRSILSSRLGATLFAFSLSDLSLRTRTPTQFSAMHQFVSLRRVVLGPTLRVLPGASSCSPPVPTHQCSIHEHFSTPARR